MHSVIPYVPATTVLRSTINIETEIEKLSIACSHMGYKVLETEIHPTPLAELLASIDIEILDNEAVSRYQEKLLKRVGNNWEWVKTPIAYYDKEIPIYALRKATLILDRIKEINLNRYNEISFGIESLELHIPVLYSPISDPDPFMYIHLGNNWSGVKSYDRRGNSVFQHLVKAETYYIEVWDEPGFKL